MAARELEIPGDEAIYDDELKSLKLIHQEFTVSGGSLLNNYRPSFQHEIMPLLERPSKMKWVFAGAAHAHTDTGAMAAVWKYLSDPSSDNRVLREFIFGKLRPPPGISTEIHGDRDMPRLLGDEPLDEEHHRFRLTLTRTQYAILKQWCDGKFDRPSALPAVGQNITPHGLDRAALENCAGGAFYPGMECGWQIRHKELYIEPFRINHNAKSIYWGETNEQIGPGYFSRQMAVPWQADFRDCKLERYEDTDFGWWPAQRPDWVHVKDGKEEVASSMKPWHRATRKWKKGEPDEGPDGIEDELTPSFLEMVKNWFKFGFVLENGKHEFLETERNKKIP
jgi:L-lysine epsilon oxidase C-terminal domain